MSCNLFGRIYPWIASTSLVALFLACPLYLGGCGSGGTPSNNNDGPSTTDTGGDGEPSSYKGEVSGTISDSRSTRESVDAADGETAAQELPSDFDADKVVVSFEDLAGDPLLDQNGQPFPPVTPEQEGEFLAQGLPVGIDIVVTVDLTGDGNADIEQIVQIPADESGLAGRIDNVVVDPLTTLVMAKLRELFERHGIDPAQLDISPTAIVHRVVDAFIHLFEESGIDQIITVEDVRGLTPDDLAMLFDEVLPAAVRVGVESVEGNLALGRAAELVDTVIAAAEVFLRAGFPIADEPDGFDLSFLADLPDVEILSAFDLRPPDEMMLEVAQFDEPPTDTGEFDAFFDEGMIEDFLASDEFAELLDGGFDGEIPEGIDAEFLEEFQGEFPEGFDGTFPFDPEFDGEGPTIYVSTLAEPDRNFISNDEFGPGEGKNRLPILSEHLLTRMAKLHLEGRVITLANLHKVLTDAEIGLGARLTYPVPTFERMGPPPMMFETADGEGVARNIEELMYDLLWSGLAHPGAGFEELETQKETIRAAMLELLAGTIPPSLQRMFGVILRDRIESVEQIFEFVRKARSHLPFSRSGPSAFFVVADGDPFRQDAGEVNPVSVHVDFGPEGIPIRVSFDPTRTGRYYLGFTHETERNNGVELLVRETGRWLHGPHGERLLLDMGDQTLFPPVNGQPFVDFVSEEGTFWPGISISVADPGYQYGDTGDGSSSGPDMQLFVLATQPGPDGEPVRVDFDLNTRTFTYNASGRYHMMFVEESHESGLFGLYDVELGFMASVQDLSADFFVPPPEEFFPPPPEEEFLPPLDEEMPPLHEEASSTTEDDVPPPEEVLSATEPDAVVDEPPAAQEVPATGDTTTSPEEVEVIPPPEEEPPLLHEDELPPPDSFEPVPMPIWEPAFVAPSEVVGLDVRPEFFHFVYGTEVPNENYDPSGNPYFDDANGNGMEDPGEFTADFRPTLWNPDDWRSTDIPRYYRRASGGVVLMDDIEFEAEAPKTRDGEGLVARNFLPRLNAFKFGRPNAAINLLTTFLPPQFFDGTHKLTADTPLSIFQAMATINLVMEQTFNVEAIIDIDGGGPFEAQKMLIDAHIFVLPIGDPFVLLLDGFETLSEVPQN